MALNDEERRRVSDAVRSAEAGLTAEIVPCVFSQSSRYPESIWAGAAAGMSLAVAGLYLLDVFRPTWTPLSRLILTVPFGGLLGAALGRWHPGLRRAFIGGRRMKEQVERRAKEVFFDRGLSRTAARDGVLVFASLLERRVVVLADEGVRAKVDPKEWDAVVAAMTEPAAEGRVADGLCAAVLAAAAVLQKRGFGGKPRSGNELGDEPVEGDA